MITGTCKYCRQEKMIEGYDSLTQEAADAIATEECTCKAATKERERVQQRTAVAYQIEQIIEPRSAAAAGILREAIEVMQLGNVKKLTITTADKWTLSMQRTANGIKVSAQTTYTEEEDVY